MNVRKFIAANARDAFRKVKESLGNDAIILSNRGVPGGVEIMAVAARDMAMIVPNSAADTPVLRNERSAHTAQPQVADEDYRVLLSTARARVSGAAGAVPSKPAMHAALYQAQATAPVRPAAPAPARSAAPVNAGIPRTGALRQPDAARPAAPAGGAGATPARPVSAPRKTEAEVVPQAVMDEIRSLRRIVEQHLAGFAWGETARSEPVKTEVLRQMLDAGFSPQLSRELLQDLPPQMDVGQAMAWVKGVADRVLLTMHAENDIVDRGGVYALVGPTGVGKTTTTAKLAARCVLRHGPSKVALVTTDGYRIGAHEQLKIYGRILGVPVYLVKDALELRQTLNELQHKHMVLIDTMGMSQKDKLVPEMTDMLAGCDVQRLLVLASTSRGDTLDDVLRAYTGELLAGCILSKIDEAASLATPLDVIMRHGLPLFYVSNGQRVPEDLHLPNRSYLLHRAFKDVPENSPHKFSGVEPGLLMANAGLVAAGGRRG
ncbi:MAG: flagellar biosynthesis protein FlhF [Azonexus sp.]